MCQDSSGRVEPVYDILQELVRYFLCYVHHWHSFHPLGKYVDCDE
jgi:hypothetical protein